MLFAIRRFVEVSLTQHCGRRAIVLPTTLAVLIGLLLASPGNCADQKPSPEFKVDEAVQLPVLFTSDPWTHSFVFWQPSGEMVIWDTEKRAVIARLRPAAKVADVVAKRVRQYADSQDASLRTSFIPLASQRKLVVRVVPDWFVIDTQNGEVVSQYCWKHVDCIQQWFVRDGRTIVTLGPWSDGKDEAVTEFDFGLGKEIKRYGVDVSKVWIGKQDLSLRLPWLYDRDRLVVMRGTRSDPESVSTAVVWDLVAGKEVQRISLDQEGFFDPRDFSPDGTMFACTSDLCKEAVTVRETRTGKMIAKFVPLQEMVPVRHARFSKKGDKLLLGPVGPTAIQWNWKSDGTHRQFTVPPEADSLFKRLASPDQGDDYVGHCEQWSADESRVFMVGHNLVIYEFDATTGEICAKHPIKMNSIPPGARMRGIDCQN